MLYLVVSHWWKCKTQKAKAQPGSFSKPQVRDAEVAVDPTQHEHPSNLYVSLHTRQDVRADEHEQQQHPVQIDEGLMLLSSEDDRLGSSPPTARLLAPSTSRRPGSLKPLVA